MNMSDAFRVTGRVSVRRRLTIVLPVVCLWVAAVAMRPAAVHGDGGGYGPYSESACSEGVTCVVCTATCPTGSFTCADCACSVSAGGKTCKPAV